MESQITVQELKKHVGKEGIKAAIEHVKSESAIKDKETQGPEKGYYSDPEGELLSLITLQTNEQAKATNTIAITRRGEIEEASDDNEDVWWTIANAINFIHAAATSTETFIKYAKTNLTH